MVKYPAVINMNKQIRGILYLVTATIIWGSAFIAQSVGMEHIGPFTFQAVRCMLAVLFLLPASLAFDLARGRAKQFFRDWCDPQLWKVGTLFGLALFVAASLQQVGLVYSDAGKAGFITAMYIVLVPILGLILGSKPPRTILLSVIIAVAGLYLLSCKSSSGINIGDICIMGAALFFAIQITLIDRFAGSLDGVRLNCVQALVVAVVSIPFACTTEVIDPVNIQACWSSLLFAGVLSMGVAYTLQILGQKDLEPTSASLIMSLESVFAALGGWLVLHETMTPWELTGSAMVFSAVILSQIPDRT